MGNSLYFDKWGKLLKTLVLLPFPNRMLSLFPPPFVTRDPIFSLIQKARSENCSVGLLLFHLNDYYGILKSKPGSFVKRLHKNLQKIFVEVLFRYMERSDVIGVKHIFRNDIAVFIRLSEEGSLGKCSLVAEHMKEELEAALHKQLSLHLEESVKFQTGCCFLDKELADTETAMQSAYHGAMEAAAKNLHPHYVQHRMQLESIIRNEAISVLTQPIMDLKNGEIYGWEVLTRGPSETNFQNPAELFELADEHDLLPQLEWLVMDKALREIADRGIEEQVFINITPVSFSDPKLLNQLLAKLKEYSIDSSQIVFEITERQSINDFEQMAKIVRAYRSHGFRVAVDDAGAGYSTLQSISELIPDIIKIDKSVIRNIDRESVKQALLRSLLSFAENINCQVIAEGVEREEEASVLLLNQVHMGQGFYFAKPEPFEQGKNALHFADLKEKIIRMRHQVSAVV